MPKLRRPRDANGFMVPLEGTKSRVIYELLRRGLRTREIIEATGYSPGSTKVLIHKIRNPRLPMDWYM